MTRLYQDPAYEGETEYEELVGKDASGRAKVRDSKLLHADLPRWRSCLERMRDSVNLQIESREARDAMRGAEHKVDGGVGRWDQSDEHLGYLRWRSGVLSFKRSVVERMEYVGVLIMKAEQATGQPEC